MTPALHPAIRLLVDEVRMRLKAPELPDSALRGALLEALRASEAPPDRLTLWIEDLLGDTVRVVCRRLGMNLPSAPSLSGILTEEEPRDLSAEVVQALLADLDHDEVSVLKQLEVRDAREAQVAVRLGLPPKRVGVMARQAREQVWRRLLEHAAEAGHR